MTGPDIPDTAIQEPELAKLTNLIELLGAIGHCEPMRVAVASYRLGQSAGRAEERERIRDLLRARASWQTSAKVREAILAAADLLDGDA